MRPAKPSAMDYPALRLFVAGRWIERASGGAREVTNPADGTVLGSLPLAGAEEIDAAAEAAARGFAEWRRASALTRAETLRRATGLMRDRAERIARTLTLEEGKPLAEALREVRLSADIIDFQADEARRLYGRTIPPRVEGVLAHQVMRQPVGPAAAFTAWNFPINLPSRKLGSALAAGCSVVLKPAEETPGSAVLLVECLLDAGVPALAINLLCGDPPEVSSRLIAHPAIRKVSLTGSVAVGRALGEQCAARLKPFTAELGGHAPVIVCEDADPAFALKLSIPAKFRNAGQVCASPIRFFIQRRHYAAWERDFAAAARALKLGHGLDPATQMGPLAHQRRVEDMEEFVCDAREHGARVLTGGERLAGPGHFFAPTVIVDAPEHSRVMRIEPFGPIAVLVPFDRLDEAIEAANALPYALGAYAFTRDLGVAHRLAEEISAGMVGINHYGVSQPEVPFGGWRDSGAGLEMGSEGLLAYTELKTVTFGASA